MIYQKFYLILNKMKILMISLGNKSTINQNGFKNTALIYSISDNSNLGGKIGC